MSRYRKRPARSATQQMLQLHSAFSPLHAHAELKEAIQNVQYRRVISPVLHTKIEAAKIVKKKLKEALSI